MSLVALREVITSLKVIVQGRATPESITEALELDTIEKLARQDPDRATEDLLYRILDFVELGLISPRTACSYASILHRSVFFEVSLPLETLFGPPRSADPAHWTLAMSVLWVATRSIERVREHSPNFRRAARGWRAKAASPRDEQEGFFGFEHGDLEPLPIKRLAAEPGGVMSINEAVAALWSALLAGRMVASSGGSPIPSGIWESSFEGEFPDTLVQAARPGVTLYENVRIEAESLRAAFPPKAPSMIDTVYDGSIGSVSAPAETPMMAAIRKAIENVGVDTLARYRMKKEKRAAIRAQMRRDGYTGTLPTDRSFQRFATLLRSDSDN
jgi:hypothetical protein